MFPDKGLSGMKPEWTGTGDVLLGLIGLFCGLSSGLYRILSTCSSCKHLCLALVWEATMLWDRGMSDGQEGAF